MCNTNCYLSSFHRRLGLTSDAVPTIVNAPNPPPPLGKRKPPKERHELPTKRRKTALCPPSEESTGDQTGDSPTAEDSTLPTFEDSTLSPSCEDDEDVNRLHMNLKTLKTQVNKLRFKIRGIRKASSKAGKKRVVLQELQHLLPARAFAFVSTQLRLSQRARSRWTTEDKTFFLSLWHASPKCYRLLARVFTMPSVSTLKRVIKAVDVQPGFNANMLSTLGKAMENARPIDKICAIVTDEMSLKEALHYVEGSDRVEGFEDFGGGQRTHYVANHASVFMVRGIFTKWKQVFGYCLTSGPIHHVRLQSLLLQGIRELREAGLECVAFVCDQGAGNRAMLSRLGVSKEQPFFQVDGVPVFCLWDPPHLIKNIRNNWRKHGFSLDGANITWDVMEALYAYDSAQDIRMCPRLTKKHVHLPPFACMRVRLATQVLSHSVAVGITVLAGIKGLTGQQWESYQAAARLCENFNSLFDCFNSKELKDSTKLKCAVRDGSSHFAFLDSCMDWLPRLTLSDGKGLKKIPCVEGWEHNITCLKMLWAELRKRQGVSYLLTNRLNQDCLENVYSSIRGLSHTY